MAPMLDIGGESSRPGALPPLLEDELARVLPVVRGAVAMGVPVSVDTYKPEVMQAVLDMGADIINDIWALRQPGAAAMAARYPDCGVRLMHMHRELQTMQVEPMQGDVVAQVLAFLRTGPLQACTCSESSRQSGSSSTSASALARQWRKISACWHTRGTAGRRPSAGGRMVAQVVAGHRHQQVIGQSGSLGACAYMVLSVAAALLSVERGASIVRVHDVRETMQALAVLAAIA